ncbi:hypothetical protein [Synechococcus elongatus]|uniref:hypothetical protein n=1 Tax=Synechococcus elongatus TaxID=32046 RepID=UPI001EE0A901|nr:hypothetical protein [Synechococcus elongatus]
MKEITFPVLQLLWPRGDGAVRMLMYLLKLVLNQQLPNFTDRQLAKRFYRSTRTIERWRARWEDLGVLTSDYVKGRTWYGINLPRLRELIAQAQIALQAKQAEAHAQQLQARQQLIDELTVKLVTISDLETSLPRHDDNLQPDILSSADTDLNFISCSTTNESAAAEAISYPAHMTESRTLAEQHKRSSPKKSKTGERIRESTVNQSKNRRYWIEAAQRLVSLCGQQWNQTLTQLLESLEFADLVRAVCAFWEQVSRGNVKNAPAWLTRAVQRRYRATRRFVLPDHLPVVGRTQPSSHDGLLSFLQPQDEWDRYCPGQPKPAWWQVWLSRFGTPPELMDTDDGLWVVVRAAGGSRLYRLDEIAAQFS